MKRLTILLFLLISLPVWAQLVDELKFKEEEHDFGLIKEVDGPAEFTFEFTNVSQEPVTITNVRASCGCTTPAWTREPVMPGESGFIKAVYNPTNRPGPFHKTLTVTTNGKQQTIILRIKGQVEPKPRTIEDDFPTVVGALRSKYRAFNMGRIYTNTPVTKEFEVYNQSEKPLTFRNEVEAPPYIRVDFSPATVAPFKKGKIIITYDGKMRNDLGFMSDNIIIYTDEEGPQARKTFSVYADINEYFPPMSAEEAAIAPKMEISERVHDFGKVEQGKAVSTEFIIKNTGKSPLNIRKTHSSCGCTVAALAKETLQPDEEVKLKVTFNTTGRRGTQQKSITIYSNDPVQPVQRVTIKASVQTPN